MIYKFLVEKIKTLLELRDFVHYIGGSDVLPPPLSREEEENLMQRLDAEPELLRKTLIEHNLRLVVYIAKKFESSGVGVEDLVSIGTIGLIKAINTFDPMKKINNGNAFFIDISLCLTVKRTIITDPNNPDTI